MFEYLYGKFPPPPPPLSPFWPYCDIPRTLTPGLFFFHVTSNLFMFHDSKILPPPPSQWWEPFLSPHLQKFPFPAFCNSFCTPFYDTGKQTLYYDPHGMGQIPPPVDMSSRAITVFLTQGYHPCTLCFTPYFLTLFLSSSPPPLCLSPIPYHV